jgi:hypothetical protein
MVFGGVATGNMKANDVAMAAGSIMYMGCICIPKAWKVSQIIVLFVINVKIHFNYVRNHPRKYSLSY